MNQRTVGVEEEFLLVDAEGMPRAVGDRVVASGRAKLGDPGGLGGLEHELQQEQAETGTQPRLELAELLDDLKQRRATLAAAAGKHGVSVAALGTSPVAVQPTPTDEPRYQRLMSEYGPTAQEQLTCGCHVHVGISSRDEGVRAINGIQLWLPVLIALSANSPFWQGEDTGYASYRRMVWGRWPGAGPTGAFADADEYDEVVGALVGSGVLLDQAMVYFDVRLSVMYPTVEIRVADVCPEPEDTLLVAALTRALVEEACTDAWPSARTEMLAGAGWQAARSGLEGQLMDPVTGTTARAPVMLQRLVDRVGKSLEKHGDLDMVEASMQRLLDRGSGAKLQRDSFERTGSLSGVVADAVARTSPQQ